MAAFITALALIGVTVTPGTQYGANGVYRFFFGSQWRDAWTMVFVFRHWPCGWTQSQSERRGSLGTRRKFPHRWRNGRLR